MDYNSARSRAVTDSYGKYIQDFLSKYRKGMPTVVMLPGGMGSQLDRSGAAFTGSYLPFADFRPVWLGPGILLRGDALHLEMTNLGADIGEHIIVPDGPLRFLVKAYDGAERFFRDKSANYIVFGYDWRRPLEQAAINLKSFITALSNAVFAQFQEQITGRLILLCHSQGGLVAKIFLNDVQDNASQWFAKLITVATPFYGTATHMQRYFQGEKILNILHGSARVARIIGTLPGPYTLMPIDLETWKRRGKLLGAGDTYPIVDETNMPIDPYDGKNATIASRYPKWVRKDYVDLARDMRHSLDADVVPLAIANVFHIRAAGTKTHWRFRWDPMPDGYEPGKDKLPIVETTDVAVAKGDGTVPNWSARLAQVPDERVLTLDTADEHQALLENYRSLESVWFIITHGRVPAPGEVVVPDGPYAGLQASSADEVHQFIDAAAKGQVPDDDPRWRDEKLWRGTVRQMLK